MKTIPVRLKIARFINSFRSEHSFEKALTLSTELSAVLKSCSVLIEVYCMSSTPPTAFQTKLFDLLVQRFLLALHNPFAVKAMFNPLYYYLRKVCLETFHSPCFRNHETTIFTACAYAAQVCSAMCTHRVRFTWVARSQIKLKLTDHSHESQ